MAADSTTAMTVDFLRARLLSERSVSRAAKERADELANRVAELEEQLREVTAQRRQAERATTEVLAILESQGFGGHLLSDADDDSGSDQDGDDDEDARSRGDTVPAPGDEKETAPARGAAEDALSGTHAQTGGLSWKGRSVSPRKARQLKQKHRRSYFYLLSSSSDSSPKYRMGQSCRKNKRQTAMMSNAGRSVSPSPGEDAVAAEGQQDGSDCTFDGQDDMDGGEAGGDERGSGDGGSGQYVIRYEKDGEMERVLERQAELIEQYEEEEKAQREWEKQYNENQNADNKVAAEVEHKPCQNSEGGEDIDPCTSQAAPCDDKVPPTGSLSDSPQNTSQENGAQLRKVNATPDQSCAQTASVSAHESSNASSAVTRQEDEEISDGDSCVDGTGARASPRHCAIKTPSEGSPSSGTHGSKVSDWSSSQFHDHTDSQQSYHRPASSGGNRVDVGSVLEALQRARISLSAKLRSKPVPPSQVTLALPAPGDDLIKERDGDLPGDDGSCSSYRDERGSSSPARQEILALPAPEDYREERVDLPLNDTVDGSVREKPSSSGPPRQEMLALPAPGDEYCREIDECKKIPACSPGLFRLPTDSFPEDERMFASSGYGLRAAATRHATGSFSSNPSAPCTAATETEAPSTSGDGSGLLSAQQYYDLYSSVVTAGRCNSMARPDLSTRERDTSFLSGVPGLGDADLFMQRGIDYTISNKWML